MGKNETLRSRLGLGTVEEKNFGKFVGVSLNLLSRMVELQPALLSMRQEIG